MRQIVLGLGMALLLSGCDVRCATLRWSDVAVADGATNVAQTLLKHKKYRRRIVCRLFVSQMTQPIPLSRLRWPETGQRQPMQKH
jgi:hypothetical protein